MFTPNTKSHLNYSACHIQLMGIGSLVLFFIIGMQLQSILLKPIFGVRTVLLQPINSRTLKEKRELLPTACKIVHIPSSSNVDEFEKKIHPFIHMDTNWQNKLCKSPNWLRFLGPLGTEIHRSIDMICWVKDGTYDRAQEEARALLGSEDSDKKVLLNTHTVDSYLKAKNFIFAPTEGAEWSFFRITYLREHILQCTN